MSKKITKLTVSCDDNMFMSGEINLRLDPNDGLGGIKIGLNLQADLPIYLRKYEIKDLIEALQKLHDLIPD